VRCTANFFNISIVFGVNNSRLSVVGTLIKSRVDRWTTSEFLSWVREFSVPRNFQPVFWGPTEPPTQNLLEVPARACRDVVTGRMAHLSLLSRFVCFHARPRQATDVLQPAGLLYRLLLYVPTLATRCPRAYRRVPHSSGGSWNLWAV
jgi:hypothetical protein